MYAYMYIYAHVCIQEAQSPNRDPVSGSFSDSILFPMCIYTYMCESAIHEHLITARANIHTYIHAYIRQSDICVWVCRLHGKIRCNASRSFAHTPLCHRYATKRYIYALMRMVFVCVCVCVTIL